MPIQIASAPPQPPVATLTGDRSGTGATPDTPGNFAVCLQQLQAAATTAAMPAAQSVKSALPEAAVSDPAVSGKGGTMMAGLSAGMSSNLAGAAKQSSVTGPSLGPVPAATVASDAGAVPAEEFASTAQSAQQAIAPGGTKTSVQADSQTLATQSTAEQGSGKASTESAVCAPVDGELFCADPQGPLAHKAKGSMKLGAPVKGQGGKHHELHKPDKAFPAKGVLPGAVLLKPAESGGVTLPGSAAVAAKVVAADSARPESADAGGAGKGTGEMGAGLVASLGSKTQLHALPPRDANAGVLPGASVGSFSADSVAARSDATQPLLGMSGDDAAHAAAASEAPTPATLLEAVKPAQGTTAVSFTPSLISGISRTSFDASTGVARAVAASRTGAAAGAVSAASGAAAGGKGLEVGFQDSTLGWLSVRASTATGGELHLSIGTGGERSSVSLREMLPDLKNYLDQHGVATDSLTAFNREHGMLGTSAAALQGHGPVPGVMDGAFPASQQHTPPTSGAGHGSAAFRSGAEQGSEPPNSSASSQEKPQQQGRSMLRATSTARVDEPGADVSKSSLSSRTIDGKRMLSVRI